METQKSSDERMPTLGEWLEMICVAADEEARENCYDRWADDGGARTREYDPGYGMV